MKKSHFIAMLLGTISIIFLGIGMCMTMLPEWNAYTPGIVMGSTGLLIGLITIAVWRRMEHKAPIKITGKTIFTVILGIIGALALGVGMCFAMLWSSLIPGILIGTAGILMLICLIPICKGVKN